MRCKILNRELCPGATTIKPPRILSMHDLKICLQFLFFQLSLSLSEALQRNAKHEARLSNISVYLNCHSLGQPSEILRFAQNDTAYGSDHSELHSAGFANHVLIPRRVPNELHIGFIAAVYA